MTQALRESYVASATSFLKDEKVQSAPLAKRVAFLESKGLTQEEIKEAIARADGTSTTTTTTSTPSQQNNTAVVSNGPPLPPNPYMAPVVQQQRYISWKDICIGAVVISSLGFGAFKLLKKYLPNALQIPSTKDLEENNQELTKQIKEAGEALTSSKIETESAIKLMESQGENINKFMENMSQTLTNLKSADQKRDEEIRTIKEELENVKDMLPKIIEKSKETNDKVLQDLQGEIKSLKSLLVNRVSLSSNNLTTSSTSLNGDDKGKKTADDSAVNDSITSRFSFLNQKPSIPAWQIQATSDTPNSADETTSSTPTNDK